MSPSSLRNGPLPVTREAPDVDANKLAVRLLDAAGTRQGIPPLTDEVEFSLAQAYEIQDAVLERLPGGAGRTAKLGLTSRAKQQQMNVDEPLYGWFGENAAIHPDETLDTSSLIQPRVEPEIAFLLGEDLAGPGVTTAHVIAATIAVMPAIDVLDSRFSGYNFKLADVVADNCSAARYCLGDPVPIGGIDLRTVGCVFRHNGRIVDTAAGAAVMDHPAGAVAWLARKLASRGRVLSAGTAVLAGSLTAAVPVVPGDVAEVTVDRIGTVRLRCT